MSNMESNAEKANNDKRKIKLQKLSEGHNVIKMFGIIVYSPHVLKGNYFAPTQSRINKSFKNLEIKALQMRLFHEFKYKLIEPRDDSKRIRKKRSI